MKECPNESFKREKGFKFVSGHPKRVAVLNLPIIHLDPKLIRSVSLKLSDPYSLLDWVLHYQVLPLEIELCLKGVLVVISFI